MLELYPSRRIVVRFDAGDTIIHYGEHNEVGSTIAIVTRDELPIFRAAAKAKHNFQFTAGVGFRFSGGDVGDENKPQTSSRKRPGRFELGIQFSSLALRLSERDLGFIGTFDARARSEAGFGGRGGYNLNDNVAFEAEGNFYPRQSFSNSTTGGTPMQMQFGAKVGRRFERFGVFAKARPGFVTFSRVITETGTQTFIFGPHTQVFGTYEERRKTYLSMDFGAVLELYLSSRFFTRFDAGDTMTRYGRRSVQGAFVQSPDFNIPAKTAHNFQFTTGIGLRF